ncbi:MAG: hypothetical protein DRP75_03805 [Candidatus Omnitrophota bacterium]|nr:MAG: hypothetical protein DRP75_03805 [Candidatus Omnitrophota bacterium]
MLEDIRPLKPPAEIKTGVPLYLFLLFFLLCAGLVYLIKRREKKKRKIVEEPSSLPSAQEVVRQRLEELERLGLIQKGEVRKYYFLLSEIIREYIGRCFNFPAMDYTTSEIIRELKRKASYEQVEIIRDFLQSCDIVKFARYQPLPREIEKDKQKAERIIAVVKEGSLE